MMHPLIPRPSLRRNGKVARLPRETRDMINRMLDDGLSYTAIIEALGDAGKGLNTQNLCNWRKSGYQEWVTHQAQIDETKAATEHAIQLLRESDGALHPDTVAQAGHMIGAVQLMQALIKHGDDALKNMLAHKPETYIRILNASCRLAKSDLPSAKRGGPNDIKPNQPQSSQIKL